MGRKTAAALVPGPLRQSQYNPGKRGTGSDDNCGSRRHRPKRGAGRRSIWALLICLSHPCAGGKVVANDSSDLRSVFPECAGIPIFIGDGDCDQDNNTAECGFDGGDCCWCTCIDSDVYTCGDDNQGGFDCIDPQSECDTATYSPTASPTTFEEIIGDLPNCSGQVSFVGDGFCDELNNNESCRFDGGDCCWCTCQDTDDIYCNESSFDCRDPNSTCEGSTDYPATTSTSERKPEAFPSCEGDTRYIGDGECDAINNSVKCGYDGGDCCKCTCTDSATFMCGNFECIDPAASCGDDRFYVVAIALSSAVVLLIFMGRQTLQCGRSRTTVVLSDPSVQPWRSQRVDASPLEEPQRLPPAQ